MIVACCDLHQTNSKSNADNIYGIPRADRLQRDAIYISSVSSRRENGRLDLCCNALLHDVAEDTAVTLDELAKEFSQEVIEALKLLTHEKDTDHFEYVSKIKDNPIAQKVKLADLTYDMDRN